MKKALLTTALLATAGTSLAEEKALSLKVSQSLELYGAISAGYFYTNNDSADAFKLTNAVLGLKGSAGIMSFDLAVGALLAPSVWDGGAPNQIFSYTKGEITTDEAGLLWASVGISPIDKLTIDAGLLTTNVGYEVVNTYANPNITLGAVWYAQPVIYPGIRATFELTEDISVYAEYNNDAIGSKKEAFAVGSLGSVMGVNYAITYYDYSSFKNFIDVVLSYSVANVDLGLNFDYQWLDDSAKSPNQDDTAYGIALYAIPNFGNISIPVRLEYFDEGTSGIYWGGADNGFSITVTPTYRPTNNTFIRAEVAYIATDKRVFKDDTKDNKTTLAVEAGFTF